MIKLGTSDMAKAYVGSTEVSEVYLGSNLVWSSAPAPLPYDAEVEYLSSDSLAWINTGIGGGNNNLEIGMVFMFSTWVNSACLYGNLRTDSGSTGNITRLALASDEENIRAGINTKSAGEMLGVCTVDVKHTVVAKSGKIILDGVAITKNAQNGTTNNDNIILFNRGSDTVVDRNIGQKIYSFYIKDSGTFVLNLIPVRLGQVGYMYDKISKTLFGNDGTGSFVFGNDGSNLYEKEIEYLETNGSPYIDLGVKGNAATDALYIDFQATTSINRVRLIGASVAQSPCQIYQNGSGSYGYRRASTWGAVSVAGTIGTDRHTWLCDYKNLKNTIDGVNYTMSGSSSGTTSSNLLLCGPYLSEPQFVGKIYACKIYRNNVLIVDLKPVRIGQVGYMFDKVSGILYSNAGSGSFTLGNDIT